MLRSFIHLDSFASQSTTEGSQGVSQAGGELEEEPQRSTACCHPYLLLTAPGLGTIPTQL